MEDGTSTVPLLCSSTSSSTEPVNGLDGNSSAMQQDTQVRRRAPAPPIPPDPLRSFSRSQTLSSFSCQSSPFLSPPISEPWSRSPPPRPEADDYLSAKGRHLHQRRTHHRHTRRRRNTRDEGSDLHHTYEQNEEPPIPAGEDYEISGLFDAGALRGSPEELEAGPERSPKREASDRRVSFHRADSAQASSQSNSPAAQALRRLSQCDMGVVDARPGPFRRASLAIASSLGLTKLEENDSARSNGNKPLIGKYVDGGQIAKQQTNDPSNEWGALTFVRKTDGQSHQRSHPNAIPRPSSILLRKATSIHQVSAREDMNTPASLQPSPKIAGETRITPPTVELIAFYSEHKSTSIDKGDSGVSPENRVPAASLAIAHLGPLSRPTRQQRGAAAELAVTYTDVHIAPGTFSTTVKPPYPLLSSEASELLSSSVGNASTSSRGDSGTNDAMPRICAVQLRTTNSVHEVIWREDETTSGSSISCSPVGSVSPALGTQFGTIGGGGSVIDGGRGQDDQDEGGRGSEIIDPDGGGDAVPTAECDDDGGRGGRL